MFNGVQELTIDNKGRLAIPAKFREVLKEFAAPVLCVTLKDRSHLLLYPENNWAVVRDQLMNLPAHGNRRLRQLQQLVLGYMEKLEPDAAGRILLPGALRKLVEFGQDKEVIMVGRADRLEIWGKGRWEEETRAILDLAPEELEAALKDTDLLL